MIFCMFNYIHFFIISLFFYSISNFQGIRKRVLIVPDYSLNDERLKIKSSNEDEKPIENEYNQLDLTGEQFEAFVRPKVEKSQWIIDRKHERDELDRLGDLVTFFERKPKLSEFEKRVYRRLTCKDKSIQTDVEIEKNLRSNIGHVPVIHLPAPLAMRNVEDFLVRNHWRLLDLFRALDRDKTWTVVKEDFKHLMEKVEKKELVYFLKKFYLYF